MDLKHVTLICQDWGSLIGLRVAMEQADRFDRIVVANGFLPTGEEDLGRLFKIGRLMAPIALAIPVGRLVNFGCGRDLSKGERRAYDAPFPSLSYKAGVHAFPGLVPTSPDDPAARANRDAWERLGEWEKPFLTLFGSDDPLLGKFDAPLQAHVPGSDGQPHARLQGHHFVQEDAGREIARRTLDWIRNDG